MKKIIHVLLIFVLALACVGCGDNNATSPAKIGALAPIGMGENDVKTWTERVAKLEGKEENYKNNNNIILFDDMTSMVMALKSKQIDRFGVCSVMGDYIVKRNHDLKLIDKNHNAILGYSMAMKKENSAVIEEINKAFHDMKNDGTLDKLVKENITELGVNEPKPVAIPVIPGAATYKVAITGDLPPLDYVQADGAPAGFNVAVLSELVKRTKMNFQPVSVNAGGRGTALVSDKVDILFWTIGTYDADGKALPYALDKMQDVSITEPYYLDRRVAVERR
ncbi:MAG: transporter substrate-binding domain-containing protein [Selenomonadaceae bacterium]|nr:transporter substrate-binding domain-containing protein [Selenomonadaceae bacterium]